MGRRVTFLLLPAFFTKAVVCAALFMTGAAVSAKQPPCHHDQTKEQSVDCCKTVPLEKSAEKLDLPPVIPVVTLVPVVTTLNEPERQLVPQVRRLFLTYQILLI